MHHLMTLGHGIATGHAARRAFDTWVARGNQASRSTERPCVVATQMPIGRAVWIVGPFTTWRGMIVGFDALSGRHLVADIDRPHRQHYVASDRIQLRHVGENAPAHKPHGGVA